METGIYQIAGLVFEIHSLFHEVQAYCSEYQTTARPDYQIAICEADIDFERIRSDREQEVEHLPHIPFSDSYLETLAVYRKIADICLTEHTLLFHGSAISVDGCAYLFTAASGTGKSTHARLWRRMLGARAVMVNDDKPLLRLTDQGVLVCGTPWNGKHRLGTNCMVPLRSIALLERGTENEIHEISAEEALPMLMQQSYRPSDGALRLQWVEILNELCTRLRFYRLRCNMEPEAAEVSFHALHGDVQQ